jgi:hypothetical protein
MSTGINITRINRCIVISGLCAKDHGIDTALGIEKFS